MDYAPCYVVYVDRTAPKDKLLVERGAITTTTHLDGTSQSKDSPEILPNYSAFSAVDANVQTLLKQFTHVYLCTSGKSCLQKLSDIYHDEKSIPTVVLIDVPYEDQQPLERRETRTPSPSTKLQVDGGLDEEPGDIYGLKLLQKIVQHHTLSKLVVPVAVVATPTHIAPVGGVVGSETLKPSAIGLGPRMSQSPDRAPSTIPLDHDRTKKYLDVGAIDVLTSPLSHERMESLGIHAYRAHKDATKSQTALLEIKRGRKRSWVGYENKEPYSYLREAMVSTLMDSICHLGKESEPTLSHISSPLSLHRQNKIADVIGQWNFSAHEFTEEELIYAAQLMLQHALMMPELKKWRVPEEELTRFLAASRNAYNTFVPYHNFRHVIDVLQATFHSLLSIGALPRYPHGSSKKSVTVSPIAALIRPFDALTLLITAIGHDVGHPGVNNSFLVVLNAPLAQLYNDNSVLESFHCAAYSQILRRFWPAAFNDLQMRKLMISSILATDMQLHPDYMKQLGWLQDKLHTDRSTDGWNEREIDAQRTLACSLLIKCADISNVARQYDIAAQWTKILVTEFSRQAEMEKDLSIPTQLFAAPTLEIVALGSSQITFMNLFALPLFQGVSDIMPGLEYCVIELERNKEAWTNKINEEKARLTPPDHGLMMDGMLSPRSMSLATPSDASHQSPGSPTNSYDHVNGLKMVPSKKKISKFVPDEGAGLGNYGPMPEMSKTEINFSLSNQKFSGQTSPTSAKHVSNKPAVQMQLSYDESIRYLRSTHRSLSNHLSNGEEHPEAPKEKSRTTVTETPVDASLPSVEQSMNQDEKRKSYTTQGTNSAGTDWNSQVGGKQPLSPSTEATSIGTRDSIEKAVTKTDATQMPCKTSLATPSTKSAGKLSLEQADENKLDKLDGTRSLRMRLRKSTSEYFKKLGVFQHKSKTTGSSTGSLGGSGYDADSESPINSPHP